MTSELKRKLDKTARVYLEMRGFVVIEQNWGQSKNKIDLIAKKNNTISFVSVKLSDPNDSQSKVEVLTTSKLSYLKSAAEAWRLENKPIETTNYYSLEIDKKTLSIISFTNTDV